MTYSRLPATRLTSNLPALIVISSLFVAIAAGAVATVSFNTQSHRAIENDLTVQAYSKRNEVRALLTSVRKDLVGAAGNALVVHALDNIASSFKIMAPEGRAALGGVYRGDASPSTTIRSLSDYYGRAHDTVNPLFRALAGEMGYGDVLFLDPQGNVAYSLAKRRDFGSNVRDEALSGSILAEMFDRAKALPDQTATTTDFRPYGPAAQPVALMGTPVYEQTGSRRDLVGILVFELPRDRLDAALDDADGLDSQDVAFLVGSDGELRSKIRRRAGTDALTMRFADLALGDSGPSGRASRTTAFGTPMIAVSVPLGFEALEWTVVAAEDAEEAIRPVRAMIAWMIGTSLIATLLLAWLAATIASRLARPVVTLIERFDGALSNMPHGLVMIDTERRLILCNTAYREMYDLPIVLSEPGTPLATIDAYRRAQGMMPAQGTDWSPEGERRQLLDGRTIDVIRSPLPGGGYIATHLNVTAAVRAQQQITYLATHDALTGLPNRASVGASLTTALGQLRAGETLAVLSIDLDDFKPVNDTLGHAMGDLLLEAASIRMGANLGPGDVLARLGGDEFAILQSEIGSPDQARSLAQALIEAMAAPFEIDGYTIVIGLNVGIAIAPTDGTDADLLIKNADLALHRAKADGCGTARFFEAGMDAKLQARRRLELDLRRALAEDQFELVYQPLYDARNDTVTGVEALIRWRHPERGMISPAEFIPLAEDRGLIVPIGEWVIRRACSDAAVWTGDIRIAVNLSAIQLKSAALVDTIARTLAETGLAPQRLELEITESVLLSDDEATLATLHALKALGLRIAMDDFGTGYSSLSYLRSFPFDKIKIDQSFVRELNTRSDSVAIIRAISDLGTTLGMTTTVEGIETWDQLQIVRKQGCTEVQGYFMCRPCGVDAIAHLLATREVLSRQSA